MQIMPVLRRKFVQCLHSQEENGIEMGVETLLQLDLTRDDLDTIFSLSQMTDSDDPWKLVSTKNKAGFTRLYNKQSHKVAHVASNPKKRKAGADLNDEMLLDDNGEVAADNNEENDKDDDFIPGLISKKVPKKAAGSGNSKGKVPTKPTKTKGASTSKKTSASSKKTK